MAFEIKNELEENYIINTFIIISTNKSIYIFLDGK